MIYKKKILTGVTLFVFSAIAIAANTTPTKTDRNRVTQTENSEKVKIEEVMPPGARIVAGEDDNEFYILGKDEPLPVKLAEKDKKPESKSNEVLKNNNQRPTSEELIIGTIDRTVINKPIGITPTNNDLDKAPIVSDSIKSAQPDQTLEQANVSLDKPSLTKPTISIDNATSAKPDSSTEKVTSAKPVTSETQLASATPTPIVTTAEPVVVMDKVKQSIKRAAKHTVVKKTASRKQKPRKLSHKKINKKVVTKAHTKHSIARKSKADLIPVIPHWMVHKHHNGVIHKSIQAKNNSTVKRKLVNKNKDAKVKVAENKTITYALEDSTLGTEIY